MTTSGNCNFAARLTQRLSRDSQLIDAASGRVVSSLELQRMIAAHGAKLLSGGLEHGDRVLIGTSLSISSALAYLGAIYAGLVAVPVDDRALAASTAALIDAVGARAVWSEARLSSECAGVRYLHGDPGPESSAMVQSYPCAASDLAALMATSGSTGAPRFVMVSHGNLTANSEAIIRSQGLDASDRAMVVLPLNYCFGASLLHTHLFAGGSVVLDRRFMFPDKVIRSMVELQCTTFAGVPTVFNVLLRRSNIRQTACPHLKRFLQAGGALGPEAVDEFRAMFPKVEFLVMYGQTEATARISCMEPGRWEQKHGSAGQPLDNLTVSIVDENGNAVNPGQIGELVVSGPSVCAGYWNDPEESRVVFRNGRLHTGDYARQDDDGFLWIEGRKSAFLKMRGVRVSISEVEQKVAAMPGVYECGACAVAHPESGDALMLMVVPDQEAAIDTEQIRRSLPRHWTVDSIRLVSELPKTPAGKLARPALLEWVTNSHAAIH